MTNDPYAGKYLIEFHRVGNAVKVSAIDPRTNTEISITGPVKTTREQLTKIAVQKLEYVLNKQQQ